MPESIAESENHVSGNWTATSSVIALYINGRNYLHDSQQQHYEYQPGCSFQSADLHACKEAVRSSADAFVQWSQTSPIERRQLLMRLAQCLKEDQIAIQAIVKEEIHTSELFAEINVIDSIGMIEETAALMTGEVMQGRMPFARGKDSHALVFNEPMGVVLGIAPWNSPLILGFRAVLAPIAAGNTAILKGSELSPRTHRIIADLFHKAKFPPGVMNLLLAQPKDAVEVFDVLISNPAVKKCNFTGSTAVGRSIASKAGKFLKPVLLELGGKNCCIVLADADLQKAAEVALHGATFNNGQICMSTDTVIVMEEVAEVFVQKLRKCLEAMSDVRFTMISQKGRDNVEALTKDADAKGAQIWPSNGSNSTADKPVSDTMVSATLVHGVQQHMELFCTESFGPMFGVVVVQTEEDAVEKANMTGFGLSSAIWTKDLSRALTIAKKLKVGAIHVNASTVHDEPTLPHGGVGGSGFGRFGASWGLAEFLVTKTVILNA